MKRKIMIVLFAIFLYCGLYHAWLGDLHRAFNSLIVAASIGLLGDLNRKPTP